MTYIFPVSIILNLSLSLVETIAMINWLSCAWACSPFPSSQLELSSDAASLVSKTSVAAYWPQVKVKVTSLAGQAFWSAPYLSFKGSHNS